MRRLLLGGLLLAAVLVPPALATVDRPARDATVRPVLRLTDRDPFTVRGERFKAGERVTVVLVEQTERSLRVAANGGGSFTVAFDQVEIGRCETFWLSATGSLGSRAALKRIAPACLADKAPGGGASGRAPG